jgi:hypothetical protein
MQPADDLLAGLADGEIMELEDLPVLEAVDEIVGEEVLPAQELPETVQVDYDFDASPWQMPEGGDLRDILRHMEDDDPPARGASPRRRP